MVYGTKVMIRFCAAANNILIKLMAVESLVFAPFFLVGPCETPALDGVCLMPCTH